MKDERYGRPVNPQSSPARPSASRRGGPQPEAHWYPPAPAQGQPPRHMQQQPHPQAQQPLEDWYETTKRAEWKNLNDIRAVFNNVDFVGNDRYVFNIKGNDYRLVVVIRFSKGRVFIRFIGTHAEYDKIKDIKNI